MRIRLAFVTGLCALTALAAPAAARAEFGLQEINTPATFPVPAIPGERAGWSGGCDLSSAATEDGGLGTASAVRPHCMDIGPNGAIDLTPTNTPQWRLDPALQAGSHPDLTGLLAFERNDFITKVPGGEYFDVDENVKDIIVRLPPGVVGSPAVIPQCPAAQVQFVPARCGPESQVGMATLSVFLGTINQPVYNVEARDTVTAELIISHVAALFNVPVTARGRTNGDYGVDTLALLIPSIQPLYGLAFTVWGVPWAEAHDPYRIDVDHLIDIESMPLQGLSPQFQEPYQSAWGPIRPFFTNPTRCAASPITVGLDLTSWQDQGDLKRYNLGEDVMEGCEKLEFDPSITMRPTVAVADSPSGLDVLLKTPQNNDPPAEIPGNPNLAHDPADDTGAPGYWKTEAGLATAHLKDTTVRLPLGTSFNPAAANGVRGCTTAQIGMTSPAPQVTFDNEPQQCPDRSKIGTMEILSPLLPDPLFGEIFAAPQYDNPFPGALTAVYLVAQDEERGLSVKLAGKVDLDPDTGQISTTFIDNPQLPFDEFELHFKSGPRAPLNTPPVCGQFKNSVSLTPWSFPQSGPEPVIEDPFEIGLAPNGLGCVSEPEDRVFGPGFESGSTNPLAGQYTSFVMNVTREDGHQEFSSLSVDLPPGLSANLTDTPYCPEAAIEAAKRRTGLEETLSPSCPAASRMGSVTALAGAGPVPLPTSGHLYIAGPFDPDGSGPRPLAPFSIVVVAPAIAGGDPGAPTFDLGNVVIRSAGYVDARTAKVNIASTPVPYIVGGVPLRIRRISVSIEKPSFMLNPTNCAEASVGAAIGGAADPFDPADDVLVPASNRFEVDGCKALGFKPKLHLRFFGKTRRAANQRLRAVLIPRPGDANIARAEVTLPRSTFLDQKHIRTICTRTQFAQGACPPGSIYGRARAFTPLLREPLEGPVYLRSSDNDLPDMVAALKGQFDVELVGRIDSVKGGIRSTFDVVPDAPVSKFVLNMFGGERSLIVNSRNLCRSTNRATVRLKAQNGRRLNFRQKVRNSCKKTKRKRSRHGRGKAKKRGRGKSGRRR